MSAKNSNFDVISDRILRENLDCVFDHVVVLVSLSESSEYDEVLKSSFRKTIIIYTASIIEALLLFHLRQCTTEEECAQDHREFCIAKNIYEIDSVNMIVLGEWRLRKDKIRFDKLNLDQINRLCKDHKLIGGDLHQKIDRVRLLRNRQHLGTLQYIDRDYTKADIEFIFSVAKNVKQLVNRSVS